MNNLELVQVLQASIAPCMMISGVGLLLLSFTNRLSGALDRVRELDDEAGRASGEQQEILIRQVRILYHRAELLQVAVEALTVSLLFVALVVLLLFISLTFRTSVLEQLVKVFFVLGLLAMVTGLVFFYQDVREMLKSVRLEIKDHLHS
jgi:hypothetical protein